MGDSVGAGPGLGVTLAPAALQKEVLWPWGGLVPPCCPSGAGVGGKGGAPRKTGGCSTEERQAMDPQLPSAGMCCFQRVGVLLAWIEPPVDEEGLRVASVPESLSPPGAGGAPPAR